MVFKFDDKINKENLKYLLEHNYRIGNKYRALENRYFIGSLHEILFHRYKKYGRMLQEI